MINYIWVGMLVIGIVFAAINGTMEEVNEAIFTGAKEAVAICIGLISILVFWLGLMRVAQQAGLLKGLSRLMRPVAKRLFPEVPPDHPAMGYILSNMSANMFGLGNAATPMGIKAMEQLKELNGGKDSASRSMITLLAINTASITLIPTTVISIRMNYGSVSPTDIVGTTLVATACSTVGAIAIDRFFYYRRVRKGRE
ncbi:nucleoside recognition domain-containing protein [Halalkalibacterium halodurans]|uniref:Spore maturation protein n=2 Tax=Halalkalibacterium halodurans TaxID=86665 RepID=Q9KCJ7_HALH5|nr:nucleoside recognition domain-containing protein [Halalkalibacterium halodurans]MDY7222146.1 nucleoside recognition domain-containing protein [Halalkalibacterium halodurans]MDY7241367.1 nucleoside recognition domain-containing protein [Halalkalibacterium halodurans]MED3646788.1 nucleoside recognition domain-containing protein [Halalkalibacterium halodurans]MED4081853.1 nucleoside recognition domain-containing protein [Halalkalibacterium halodurans]MED4086410.1 nucleoside recognition domain-